MRRIPSKGAALALATETADAILVVGTGQWGSCETRLQAKAKRQDVPWIGGLDKTSSDDIGNEDLGVKPGEDESVVRRGALQVEVQELELE